MSIMTEAEIDTQLASAKAAAAGLEEKNAALFREHAEVLAERTRLVQAAPTREEALAGLAQIVDDLAALWRKENALGLVRAFGGAIEETKEGEIRVRKPEVPGVFHWALNLFNYAKMMPETVKREMTAHIMSAVYEPGPPLADRPRLIAEVDTKIRNVEHRQVALVALAAKHGMTIALIPAVVLRLKAEAEQRERQAKRVTERRSHEEPVNRLAETRVVGRGEYFRNFRNRDRA